MVACCAVLSHLVMSDSLPTPQFKIINSSALSRLHLLSSRSPNLHLADVRVGKEFPDMRQNEREIKFIRVGDTVKTLGHFKGEPTLNQGP